ncbi:ead/Ea22-like family protein [Citrobacter koseri]
MTDKQALRDIAEKTKIAGEAPVMPFEQRINALNDFMKHFTPATALAMLDELEAKDRRIEEEIGRANREHHRGFMMACGHLKEHANAHYADAAEMEIEALRKRIAELEARTVKLPYLPADCDRTEAHFKYQEAIRAAGIQVIEGEQKNG